MGYSSSLAGFLLKIRVVSRSFRLLPDPCFRQYERGKSGHITVWHQFLFPNPSRFEGVCSQKQHPKQREIEAKY